MHLWDDTRVALIIFTRRIARFRQVTGVRAAFAKAVPNAMPKTLGRVCGEIAQDHADAMAGRLEGSQGSS